MCVGEKKGSELGQGNIKLDIEDFTTLKKCIGTNLIPVTASQ
jgi:hypothetical protein